MGVFLSRDRKIWEEAFKARDPDSHKGLMRGLKFCCCHLQSCNNFFNKGLHIFILGPHEFCSPSWAHFTGDKTVTSSFGQDSLKHEPPWSPLPSPGMMAGPLTLHLPALTFTPCKQETSCPFYMGGKEVRWEAQGVQHLVRRTGFIWEPRLLLSLYFGTPPM